MAERGAGVARRDKGLERRGDDARAARTAIGRPSAASEADRLGREQQRRATAYARARGQL